MKEAGPQDRLPIRLLSGCRAGSGCGRQSNSDTPSLTAGVALNDLATTSDGAEGLETEGNARTRGNWRGRSTLKGIVGDGQLDKIMHFAETLAIEMKNGGGAGKR